MKGNTLKIKKIKIKREVHRYVDVKYTKNEGISFPCERKLLSLSKYFLSF